MSEHIFVYGTLRPGQPNYPLIEHAVQTRVSAELPGHVLRAHPRAHYPYATPGADGSVMGDLLQLTEGSECEVLETLDVLEGYRPDAPSASHYLRTRRLITIHPGAGDVTSSVEAWVYLSGPRINLAGIPLVDGGDWTSRDGAVAGRWS